MQITIDDNLIIPEFLESSNELRIPKKVHVAVNHISNDLLLSINSDINVAKELCLYFLSYLTITMYEEHSNGRPLRSLLLAHNFRSPKCKTQDNKVYINIIKALKKGTEDKGAFITVNDSYIPGERSKTYNLTDNYKCGLQKYIIKTQFVKDIKLRNMREALAKGYTNPIIKNQLNLYSYLDLPTVDQLLAKGKQLVKEGYTTKKGKKLTMLHKHSYNNRNNVWKDADNRAFVEKDIELFEYYTSYGFMIPVEGDENCPRVYDTLVFLPSWIRNEIKFDGKPMFEADYKCLHPNLIMSLYEGKSKYITHKEVADELGLELSYVKVKHLSFFNLEVTHLINSKLYPYYKEKASDVIDKVIEDKKNNGTHKHTSKLLFTLEAKLMSKVIEKLNKENIYVGYIFDALIAMEENMPRVIAIMNETVLEMNVFTTADTKLDMVESNKPINVIKENILEVVESPLKDKKTISKAEYKETLDIVYDKVVMQRWYRENESKILNELVELQTRNEDKIKSIIKKYN